MSNYDYDVVIVGAGITGAIMAEELASKQLKVLVLEAGTLNHNRQDYINQYYAATNKDPGSPYPEQPDAPKPASPDTDWKKLQPVDEQYFIQTGSVAFGSTYERMPGGTTQHWLGTALRMDKSSFRLKSEYGVLRDWPSQISYDSLEPYYTKIEKIIGVAGSLENDESLGLPHSENYPMMPIPQSYLDGVMSKRLDGYKVELGKDEIELNVYSTPQARNSINYDQRPACMGNTSCVPICPIQAKYDASVSIKKAKAKGAVFQQQSVVHRVEVDPSTNQICAVHYIQYDKNAKGRSGAAEKKVTAKRYVLAAHAIETPKLLLMSGWNNGTSVANSSGQVGLNLMDNICQVNWGLMPEPVYPFRGPLSTSGIPAFRDGSFRSQFSAFRIEIGNDAWVWPTFAPQTTVTDLINGTGALGYPPVYGTNLKGALNDIVTRQFRFAYEFEGLPTAKSFTKPASEKEYGSLYADDLGIPRPVVNYEIMDSDMENGTYVVDSYLQVAGNKKLGIEGVATKMFNQLGAKDYTQIMPDQPGKFTYQDQQYQFRGAGHIFGTARMGDNSADSVVNWEQRSWDHSNLFVVGCAVFPTTGTANPTLTAAALALWAAETICADIDKG